MRRATALLLAATAACAAPLAPHPPVSVAASRAFAAARSVERRGGLGDDGQRREARAGAERALALAPDWIAPRRFLDELDRADLLGPAVIERHRRALERDPTDAAELYLAARLEGLTGRRGMERAARLDPGSAWARHGAGWLAFLGGDVRGAERHGRGALALARDGADRAHFAEALSRYLEAQERPREAMEMVDATRRALGPGGEADRLAVRLAEIELVSKDPIAALRGARRAAALLREERVAHPELARLAAASRGAPWEAAAFVRQALVERAAAGDEAAAGLVPELLDTELALALDGRAAEALGTRDRRLARIAAGDARAAIEDWRASLPRVVLDGEGFPRNASLARVVRAARALAPRPAGDLAAPAPLDPAGARELGEALLAAGWYEEARAFARRVPTGEAREALSVVSRAGGARLALIALANLVQGLDSGRARALPELALDAEPLAVRDLDDLLRAVPALLEPAWAALGGDPGPDLADELARSPRVSYGIAGEIVHPGPVLTAQDEELGRGRAGAPVGGLAELFARMGRFALFGDAFGVPPDATVLRILWIEPRQGEHLGVPWAGSVAWCEGADLPGRAGRAGATIAGAALHEGYWVDLEPLRAERSHWMRLAERFSGPDGAARVGAALAVAPLPCPPAERAATDLLLGEADRVRLALMRDRGREARRALVAPPLDEFCAATAVHEEGHLCDRTRFYPVGRRWRALLGFLARNRFSPGLIARRLEERAHLVALCRVEDPRLPLVDVLSAAEGGGGGLTPHAEAYALLAEELLAELDRRLEDDPDRWSALDAGARLGHQLHRLAPEDVRELALAVARVRGLVAEE